MVDRKISCIFLSFTETKQELEDLMADIKKTANRVRAKLKGEYLKTTRIFVRLFTRYLYVSLIDSPTLLFLVVVVLVHSH